LHKVVWITKKRDRLPGKYMKVYQNGFSGRLVLIPALKEMMYRNSIGGFTEFFGD
jgi:ribosome modulation factor